MRRLQQLKAARRHFNSTPTVASFLSVARLPTQTIIALLFPLVPLQHHQRCGPTYDDDDYLMIFPLLFHSSRLLLSVLELTRQSTLLLKNRVVSLN